MSWVTKVSEFDFWQRLAACKLDLGPPCASTTGGQGIKQLNLVELYPILHTFHGVVLN
jgi:hypothetical protein